MRTEDGKIIQECLNGEPGAFGILVDKYKAGIYAFTYGKLGNFQDAQDVTQEVFERAYLNLRNLRRWESFAFWLYRIAYNQCRRLLLVRSRRPDRQFIEDQPLKTMNASSMDFYHEDQVNQSLREALDEALDSLPESYREVLLLFYFGGMTSKDIARAIGISPMAVLKRLSRARAQLREEMVDTMSETFQRQRLPATFTFRIVETVKRLRIKPIPRMTGLPWGLSLATGIILAILSFGSHLSIPNPIVSPTSPALLIEAETAEVGEIYVNILKISQIPVIAGRQGSADGAESGLPVQQNILLAPSAEGNIFSEEPAAHVGKGRINTITYSPDGKLIAVAGGMGIWLYDAADLTEVGLLKGHNAPVQSVAFSPDGKLLASAGGWEDNTIRLWDLAEQKELAVLKGHTARVMSVSFSPDGKLLASGGGENDNTVRLWDMVERKAVAVLSGHTEVIESVSFSPDGELLASGSDDRTVRIWDVGEKKEVDVLKGHTEWVSSVSFSPDGELLASGSGDNTVRIWDAAKGKELDILKGHDGRVHSVSFSPDGKLLASGSGDETVRIWDVTGHKEVVVLRGHTGHVMSTSFSPDGKLLASSSSEDREARIWNVAEEREVAALGGYNEWVYSLAFSPDSKLLALGGGFGGNAIRLWDVEGEKETAVLRGHTGVVESVSFSPDGELLASGSRDTTVRLWKGKREFAVLEGHTGVVNSVSFSPDGKLLASGGGWEDNTVRLWDVERAKKADVLKNADVVFSVSFSPDGKLLALGSGDNTVRLWDVAERREVDKLLGHAGPVRSLSFSPDGKWLASGSQDKTVRIWNMADRTTFGATLHHGDVAYSISFSPDGKLLTSGGGWGKDYSIQVWDVKTRKQIARLRGHTYPVGEVAFSPDGRWLVSGGWDGAVFFWEINLEALQDGRPVEPVEKKLGTWGRVKRTELYQNYPNPFNPETWIPFQLAEASDVTIRIHGQSGQLVHTLRLGQKEAGRHLEKSRAGYWDGRNDAGEPVVSGVYFSRLEADSFSQAKKMTVLR